MSRFVAVMMAAALLFLAGGCLEYKVTLLVQKDGSGTIEQTMYGPPEKPGEEAKGEKLTQEKAESAAKDLGEGVTLKTFEALPDKDGRKGWKTVYAFTDLTTLTLAAMPSMGQKKGDSKKDENIKFEFTKGPKPKIIATMPPLVKDSETPKPPRKKTPEEKEQARQQTKAFGTGMNIQFLLKVAGTITNTNATFPNTKKDGLWLVFYDLNGMIKDEAALKKMEDLDEQGLKQSESIKQAVQDKDIGKYIMIELKPKIEVEFE